MIFLSLLLRKRENSLAKEKITGKMLQNKKSPENDTDERVKEFVHIEYRGEITDTYVRALKQSAAPIKIVLTTRKIKYCLPSLKTSIHKGMQSKIVYEFTCSRCNATYLGKTKRHLKTRIHEHKTRKHQVLYKKRRSINIHNGVTITNLLPLKSIQFSKA